MVAAGLGGLRALGEHWANDACQHVGENGPVFLKKNPLNMCVHNDVSFYLFET